jgi:hypothetical protein
MVGLDGRVNTRIKADFALYQNAGGSIPVLGAPDKRLLGHGIQPVRLLPY